MKKQQNIIAVECVAIDPVSGAMRFEAGTFNATGYELISVNGFGLVYIHRDYLSDVQDYSQYTHTVATGTGTLWYITRELADKLYTSGFYYRYFLEEQNDVLVSRYASSVLGHYTVNTQDCGQVYVRDTECVHDVMFESQYHADLFFVSEDSRDEYDQQNRPRDTYRYDGVHNVSAVSMELVDNIPTVWVRDGVAVGVEIEKEDPAVLESIPYSDFIQKYAGWDKVSDGSLCDDSGFELKTPIFKLDPLAIYNYIKSHRLLKSHIDAYTSSSCGTHFNVSDSERTPWEVFDDLAGYVPLLCALYPSRSGNSYCKAKPKYELARENEKYQCYYVKRDRVEIRIFPATPDLDRLYWRLRLVDFMIRNPAQTPRQVDLKALAPLLNEVHRDKQARDSFKARLDRFTKNLKG